MHFDTMVTCSRLEIIGGGEEGKKPPHLRASSSYLQFIYFCIQNEKSPRQGIEEVSKSQGSSARFPDVSVDWFPSPALLQGLMVGVFSESPSFPCSSG